MRSAANHDTCTDYEAVMKLMVVKPANPCVRIIKRERERARETTGYEPFEMGLARVPQVHREP